MSNDDIDKAQQRDQPQVAEDILFQERTWAVQRIGWWSMGLFLTAALAGLFSTGPVSWTETHDSTGSLRIEYERFQRHSAPFSIRFHLRPEATTSETVGIYMNSALADSIEIAKIVPEPQQAKVTPSGVDFTFAVAEPGRPASIRLFLNAKKVGLLRAEVGLSSRDPARFTVFVYP